MTIHKEGHKIILILFIFLFATITGFFLFVQNPILNVAILTFGIFLFSIVIYFFRSPERNIPEINQDLIYAPADGTIVAIEKVFENEYFNEERIQISIFMSPLNVHLNRFPIGGKVKYVKYHPGKYLVAFHPKSSTKNERQTHVIEDDNKNSVMIRQIAGAVARRIVAYHKEGDSVKQGDELGFIKFGSRVDLFLPLNAEVKIKNNEKVRGNKTVMAHIKN